MQRGPKARERRRGGGVGGEAEWELSCSMCASGLVAGHGSGRKMFLFVAVSFPFLCLSCQRLFLSSLLFLETQRVFVQFAASVKSREVSESYTSIVRIMLL